MAKDHFLGGIRLLDGLDHEALTHVETTGEHRTYEVGDTIFQEGDEGSHVYCLIDGRVEICLDLEGSFDDAPLHMATPGSVFGEFVLFGRQKRSAKARATKPAKIFAMNVDAMRALFEEHPAIGYRVMDNLSKILVERMDKTTQELKASLMW